MMQEAIYKKKMFQFSYYDTYYIEFPLPFRNSKIFQRK